MNASLTTAPGQTEIIEVPTLDIGRGRYNPGAPSGGNKRSGTRRELGAGVEECLQTKSLRLPI
jgi:hypothetical protein